MGRTTTYEGRTPLGVPSIYVTSSNRAVDHVHFLSQYKTPKVQLHSTARPRVRPWDAPARQLNELGPRGYNYFCVTQADEQRSWHDEQLAQSRLSPMKRAKELAKAQGNLHQRGLQRTPALLLNFTPPPGSMAAVARALPQRPATAPLKKAFDQGL